MDAYVLPPPSRFRYLGMARASAFAGDTAKARRAYQGFFELWKDADSDVPVLKQAKTEYARLQWPGETPSQSERLRIPGESGATGGEAH